MTALRPPALTPAFAVVVATVAQMRGGYTEDAVGVYFNFRVALVHSL